MESDSSAICSDTSVGQLKELLKLESRSHRDTGQCYDTLQKEYDDLLRKYAEAENTIDKLRIDTLRERIEKRKEEAEHDVTEISASNCNIWKGLYDDLLCRTNKLQDSVTNFQAHLTNHEFAGEELNDIFDRLHNDFENIANAFQSMQALGNNVAPPTEKYPEESLLADDLEGNLYRLGLRLEEIQDEIGDQLRGTLKGGDGMHMEPNQMSNDSGSPKMMHNIDSKKSYEGGCSETETTKGEDNIESDEDNNLRLDDWRPVTDDLTELTLYKNRMGDEFLGLDPKYLSRSFSEPGNLVDLQRHGNITRDFISDLPREQVESRDSRKNVKSASASFDTSVNNRKKTSSRKPATVAQERLNLKKSPPLSKVAPAVTPPRPNVLTSPDDSGYLEGSQPGRRDVQSRHPGRHPGSPLRNHSRINEGETTSFETSPKRDTIIEESSGEQYRQRLDSLRGYILAKRAANSASSLSGLDNSEKRPKNFVRGKKTANLNYRNSPRSPPRPSKLTAVPKAAVPYHVTDLESSTTESIFSGTLRPGEEDTMTNRNLAEEERPAVQRQDIETLRDEMRGVKDIVLDLKDSLTSPGRTALEIPVADRVDESQNVRYLDDIDASRENGTMPVVAEPSQVQLQNKQFKMLENLESKLDDIARKMRTQRQPRSQHGARDGVDQAPTPRQVHPNTSPRGNYDFSYNHAGEDEHVDILKVGPRSPNCEIADEYDVYTDTRHNPHQIYSGGEFGGGSTCNIPSRKQPNGDLYQRYCKCNKCKLARDTCVIGRDNDGECRNTKSPHAQVCTSRPSDYDIPLSHHRGGVTSCNHQGGEDDINNTYLVDEEMKNIPVGRRKHVGANDSVKCYHDKFEEIGEQINKLASHVQQRKANEEERLREETIQKQKILLKTLEEKLAGLSTKMEESEKKSGSVNVSRAPMYVLSCPVCGSVGVHQHGSHVFNGHTLTERVDGNHVANMTNSARPNVEARNASVPANTMSSVRPTTAGSKQDDTFWTHGTPKNDLYQYCNGEPREKLSPSPNVYHHYHTVYSPPLQDDTSRKAKVDPTSGYYNTDVGSRDLMIGERVQDSLEKASLAALQMETLSKKMLHGIANDLFNCGPAEF